MRSLRRELAEAHSQRFEAEARKADRRSMGYGSSRGGDGSLWTILLGVGIVLVVVIVGIYAVMGG
ncbi:MAG: hypothetical protein ACREB9_02615 [Thermoplasmata archaeon]